jgi:hypothetical protein
VKFAGDDPNLREVVLPAFFMIPRRAPRSRPCARWRVLRRSRADARVLSAARDSVVLSRRQPACAFARDTLMETIARPAITATSVPDTKRNTFLTRHFDTHAGIVERQVYAQLRQLCPDYHGGHWEFYDLSNGGCYLAPTAASRYRVIVPGTQDEVSLSADATGITVTLFSLCRLSFRFPSMHVYVDRFDHLYHFSVAHPERRLISAAIG